MPQTTSIFGAFTTTQRLAVAKAILHCPIRVSDISRRTNLGQALVSQSLMKFRALDLVEVIQKGRQRYYQFKEPLMINTFITTAESIAAPLTNHFNSNQ